MKNYQILNAFTHGQLQDFLTLKTVMDKNQLTFDDIKEVIKLKISGELNTEKSVDRMERSVNKIERSVVSRCKTVSRFPF